jgi:hypothetical protein
MARKSLAALAVAAVVFGVFAGGRPSAADRPGLAGRWTLNRSLSQFPRDVGFGMDLLPVAGAASNDAASGGGGGAASAAFLPVRESEEDARRMKLLVDLVRSPSPHLMIAETESAVTISDDSGRSLTFHPDGRQETQTLDQVPVTTTTRWDAAGLVVRYAVEQNRELRYTFSRKIDPPQLVVQVQFIERGGRGSITRVYEPARADEPAVPDRAAPPPPAPKPVPEAPPGSVRASDLGKPAVPAAPALPDRVLAPVVAGGPDAELRGITALGVVVEDLSSQAAACGLDQAAIEAAVSKSFTDAGFTVRRNSDEDTYVYVHIMTTSPSAGLCVSGYDAYLYTHTDAVLPYQSAPVLVQVLLLHKGGIAGGAAGSHAKMVAGGVKQYVDEFAARIRGANQPRR